MVAASMGGLLHVTGDPAGPPTKVEGNWSGGDQGGRSCTGAQGAPVEKFGFGRKF